ncbi:MAG: hypothetical protein ABH969_03870 [Pseudomonadota bacterium]|nr:hypothetical protein [Pseudomonadota bacterium]MDH4266849.1 hypothetical protein [Deltaproteobacteria bacterium]
MIKLLGLEEMEWRHEKGEDPFALAIEKWVRIRDFLLEKADPARYKEAFQCGSTKNLFCLDYNNHCFLCPLVGICNDSQSLYYQIMRHLQVYTLAGALLPRGPLIELIEFYIRDLQGYRQEWLKKSQ